MVVRVPDEQFEREMVFLWSRRLREEADEYFDGDLNEARLCVAFDFEAWMNDLTKTVLRKVFDLEEGVHRR